MSKPTCALFLLLTALTAWAVPPAESTMRKYEKLWSESPFTIPAEAPAGKEPGPGPARMEREIAELKQRIRDLEAVVSKLAAEVEEQAKPRRRRNGGTLVDRDAAAWIREHEPKPLARPNAESELDDWLMRHARENEVEMMRRKLLPSGAGTHYHRARLEVDVRGAEENVYRWLNNLQAPTKFRGVTQLKLMPQRDDASRVHASVLVEQWFSPAGAKGRGGAATGEKWRELQPLVDTRHWPLEVLLQLAQARPPEHPRFVRVEVINRMEDGNLLRAIRIQGSATTLKSVNTFQLNLQNDKGPRSYRWRVPAPIEEPKTGHWQFLVDGAWNDPRPPEKAKKKRALQPTQLY